MIAWMAYSIVVGTFVALAAFAGERLSRVLNVPTRWSWAGALLVTLALSAAAPFRNFGRVETVEVSASASETTLTLPLEARLGEVTRWIPTSLSPFALGVWIAASAVLLGLMFVVYGRLRRASRAWPVAYLHGESVRVSPQVGPVVIGLAKPEIIVPRWLFTRADDDQRLVIAHEAEHVASRDTMLLTSACVVCAVMPWNPAAWLMLSRLRLAVEVDCDARVLRRGVELRSYGSLLIDVAEHAMPVRFGLAALANRPSHLHQRIVAMKSRVPKFARLRAGIAGVIAAGALLAACQAEMPTAAEVERMDVSSAEARARRIGSIPQADTLVYIIEGRRVSKTEAYEIAPSQIASIDIRGGTSAGMPSIIEVRTVDGARRAAVAQGGPIRLLGHRALGEANPMVLLDGVRATMEVVNKLDPKDIATIEVVKGAAAVAQFGADATNGVITIKTKK
jgi:TonB-dependent SusC/RagA subfamily outer membrane receptor